MDISLISSALSSVTAAIDIGKTALGARDAKKLEAAASEMHKELVNMRIRLIEISELVDSLRVQLAEKNLEADNLKAALHDRGNYRLVEIGTGQFARVSKVDAGETLPVDAEPVHYVCQRCHDNGGKTVLQRLWRFGPITRNVARQRWQVLYCQACKFDTLLP